MDEKTEKQKMLRRVLEKAAQENKSEVAEEARRIYEEGRTGAFHKDKQIVPGTREDLVDKTPIYKDKKPADVIKTSNLERVAGTKRDPINTKQMIAQTDIGEFAERQAKQAAAREAKQEAKRAELKAIRASKKGLKAIPILGTLAGLGSALQSGDVMAATPMGGSSEIGEQGLGEEKYGLLDQELAGTISPELARKAWRLRREREAKKFRDEE